MSTEQGRRERFYALNGLICLAQALEGQYSTVDLRNETSVYGKISQVDVFMNINMTDAVFINGLGEKYRFENFFIKDRNIRYIHIPEQVPIIDTIEKQLGKFINPGRGRGRGRGRGPAENTLKARRAFRKQKETIAAIDKSRQERLKKEEVKKEPGEKNRE